MSLFGNSRNRNNYTKKCIQLVLSAKRLLQPSIKTSNHVVDMNDLDKELLSFAFYIYLQQTCYRNGIASNDFLLMCKNICSEFGLSENDFRDILTQGSFMQQEGMSFKDVVSEAEERISYLIKDGNSKQFGVKCPANLSMFSSYETIIRVQELMLGFAKAIDS